MKKFKYLIIFCSVVVLITNSILFTISLLITFAGGIGENGFEERERICGYLECFGIKLDKERNITRGEEYKISSDDSKVDIYIVPTNEEIVIAEYAYNLTK